MNGFIIGRTQLRKIGLVDTDRDDCGARNPATLEWVALTATDLQEKYLRDVYRYVARRVDRREEAEDITAEVFAAAFQSLRKYRGDCEPRLWLLGIARRKVADYLRRPHHKYESYQSDMSVSLYARAASTASGGDPVTELDRTESCLEIRKIVAHLNEDYREALLLMYVDELSQAEIAAVMQRSPAAVNSLLQRARSAVYRAGASFFLADNEVIR